MATRKVYCPACESSDIKVINSEVIETSKKPIVDVLAKCNSYNYKFTYTSATLWGRERGIFY